MKKQVLIVGAGTAGLMAANQLARYDIDLVLVDAMRNPGRKFLVAGKGGFNLTNSLPVDKFVEKFDENHMQRAVKAFTNLDFMRWLQQIGVATYTGSSGRIFPVKGMKPAEVLQTWLSPLRKNTNVHFLFSTRLLEIQNEYIVVKSEAENPTKLYFDCLILALGGCSWPKTGSDGLWTHIWAKYGGDVLEFMPSNARMLLKQSAGLNGLSGKFIKNCMLISDDFRQMGDINIHQNGLEGTPIYAANKFVRDGKNIYLDFKPAFDFTRVMEVLAKSKNNSTGLRELNLSETVQQILKSSMTKSEFMDRVVLAKKIKLFPLDYEGLSTLEEAISVVGGIPFSEVTHDFKVKKSKAIYCIGEMLNWDAPTGGYLIQGCVSSAVVATRAIVKDLDLIDRR